MKSLHRKVIAIMNHKGGVGKTTTTLNLGHALHQLGYRVTLIDMDPQGHLTYSCDQAAMQLPGMDQVLMQLKSAKGVLREIKPNLHYIGSGPKLAEYELQRGKAELAKRLQNSLADSLNDQDFILIDSPPSSGLLVINSLFAATQILVPVTGDYLALLGISRLLNIFKHIERAMHHRIPTYYVMTRFQKQRKLAQGVLGKMLKYFPNHVYQTTIRESVSLAESPGYQQSIFDYQPRSHGAEDYLSLAQDLLANRVIEKQ